MTTEKLLQYQATEAATLLNDILENPSRAGFMGWDQETKLKEAVQVLDKLVTELKNQEKDLKA